MGCPIVKLGGKYLVWSTIADAPATYGMTRDELVAYVREEDGERGVEGLAWRLDRVEAKGTSVFNDKSAEDTGRLNRAGLETSRSTSRRSSSSSCGGRKTL